ncbi:N-acetylmuramoyl-L-alanine amidase [Candidatus Syntrophocurvum alkaliphilum]|uniref:N-acetylmuramoyl-L-alanine amidase n=1 Tax=Candidatus Syntrophocurvum alkaliphilum TaxID=2293317 RepID=A0A6I6DMM0_9FIRM|nr:N-acetylmuramoyl-L-alanine amidase [Candidatus Syntrophocurvum alkaliphilum]QGU00481.1 N-acetylmuramoyl-L-alanine amidase [Candidatus Syntrophocurvum alkaliphilum]
MQIKKLITLTTLTIFILTTILTPIALAQTGIITGSIVNVREGPGTNYDTVGSIQKDTETTVIDTSDDWYKIQTDNLTGWVAEWLVNINEKLKIEVDRDLVNIRTGPDTTYSSLDQATKGDTYTLIQDQGDWLKIRLTDGSEAYIFADLVKIIKPENQEPQEKDIEILRKIEVTASSVNLRSGPDTSYDKVDEVSRGTILNVISEPKDGWYQVKLENGDTPYIAGWLVKTIQEETSTPVPADKIPTVLINGEIKTFEVDPIIENGRTLVPLRAIFEAMGAVVEWDNDTRTVTAVKNNTVVVLPIGSTEPTVNDEKWELDVPAKIVQDRTLAPLRFVGEAFGGEVDWDNDTRTVTIDGDTTKHNPKYVNVNGDEVELRTSPSSDSESIATARSGDRMIVVDERDGWYQVSRGGRLAWVEGWVTEVEGDDEKEAEPVETPVDDSDKPISDKESLNLSGDESAPVSDGKINISTRLTSDGYRLVMKTASGITPDIVERDNGKKIVFTFEGVKTRDGRVETSFYLGSGRDERIPINAITRDDTTWVTVDMPKVYDYEISEEKNSNKQVFTIPSQIKTIREMTLRNGNHVLAINSISEMKYEEKKDGDKLYLDLPGTYKGAADSNYRLSGAGASNIDVNQSTDPVNTELKINLKDIKDYQITQSSNKDAINVILFPKDPVIPPSQSEPQDEKISVVIDPGHGGSDPGAIGYSGSLTEKEVALDISLMVEEILKEEGIDIIMTRTDDTYVGLYERAEMANDEEADLFVSIHADAHPMSDRHGTTTFYYAPEDRSSLYEQEIERSLLADLIQEELVEQIRRMDRGTRQANFAVLRETEMPSALVEVAFMTNPTEEELLKKDSFRQISAEGIANGILKYIDLMLDK